MAGPAHPKSIAVPAYGRYRTNVSNKQVGKYSSKVKVAYHVIVPNIISTFFAHQGLDLGALYQEWLQNRYMKENMVIMKDCHQWCEKGVFGMTGRPWGATK